MGFATLGFVDPLRVGQQRARHRYHVGAAGGQDRFSHLRHIDAVAGHYRNAHMRLEFGGNASECGAWHRGGNGGDARLVPADPAVEDGRASRLHGVRLRNDVVPAIAAFDQIQQGQAVDQDEIRAAGFAYLAHDLHRKAHPLVGITAPRILAPIGAGGGEFVQQIAFRAHDLHPVVAGVACQCSGGGEVTDLPVDAACTQCVRSERVDRRFQFRRRHR